MSEEPLEHCEGGQAIYLFCLARAAALPQAADAGLAGQSGLFLWRREAIAAVCNRAPVAEFCGPRAEERLGDLAWVGPRARYHAEVIVAVMRQSPVLPARFGTLFSSLERLEKLLEKQHDRILRFFDHVEGREEWAVKGWIDRMKIQTMLLARAPAAHGPPPAVAPGAAYLDRQRRRLAAQKEINLWVKAVCDEFATALAGHSADFRDRPRPGAGNRDDAGDPIANWAFLVPCAERAFFQERIKEANAVHGPAGVCFECSGPWPPYSFVPSLEAEPDA